MGAGIVLMDLHYMIVSCWEAFTKNDNSRG